MAEKHEVCGSTKTVLVQLEERSRPVTLKCGKAACDLELLSQGVTEAFGDLLCSYEVFFLGWGICRPTD